ncbi:BnaC03g12830D [Brassica napus]|nr:BnaC03g12830D [Brassica napus]VDC87610.1 unnamed protein product [Brassica oleracea]
MLLRPDELNLDLIRSVRKSPLSIPHDLQEIQMEKYGVKPDAETLDIETQPLCLLCRLASTPAMFNSTLTEDESFLYPADGAIMITCILIDFGFYNK